MAAIEGFGTVTIDQAHAFASVLCVPVAALLYDDPPPTVAFQQIQLAGAIDDAWRLWKTLSELATAD